MGFMIQLTCPKCGFQTKDVDLIDSLDLEECYVGTCNDCHAVFNNSSGHHNICPKCGSKFVEYFPNERHIRCPHCGCKDMDVECTGTFF